MDVVREALKAAKLYERRQLGFFGKIKRLPHLFYLALGLVIGAGVCYLLCYYQVITLDAINLVLPE